MRVRVCVPVGVRAGRPPPALIRGPVLALFLALLLPSSGPFGSFVPFGTAAAQTAPGAAPPGPIEPTAPRVGHVRRNAQGVIELVPPPAAAPAAEAPAPSGAAQPAAPPKPRSPPQPRTAAPAGLPPAPAPVGTPAPAAAAGQAPQAPQAAAMQASYERACPDSVLLCLGVLGGGGAQDNVPVTFGHPLAPKLLQPGQRLVGRFNGATLPVQIDQVATHYDGSVRFAVFSLVLPRVPDRGPHTLEVVPDATAALPTPPPIPPPPTDFRVEIEAYAAQVYEVKFGNRSGHTAGIPFQAGEVITLVVGEGAAQERFSLKITPSMAGGAVDTLSEIAKAFVPLFAKSERYLAHQNSAAAYETFWVTTRARPGLSFSLRFEYTGAAKLGARIVQPWEGRRTYVATLQATAAKDGLWLDGPVARETLQTMAPRAVEGDGKEHGRISAILGVRQYSGAAPRFEVLLENTFALPAGIRNLQYDVAVVANGKRLFEAKDVDHHVFARWHRYLWEPKTAGEATILHDRTRLLGSRALPSYDASLRIQESAIADAVEQYRRSDKGPLGSAMITRYMPMTGGRSDIGPLPGWAALHVLSQDPRLRPVVLGNGDASGSVPVHYRDRANGRAMNVADFPGARIYQGLTVDGKLIEPGFANTPFAVDTPHQPSLAYYPYLLTGDRFYLDELHFWASWNALGRRVDKRDGTSGLLNEDELRGQAWSMRTLGHAALITPDRHSLKQVFLHQLNANIAWYNKRFATDQPAQPGRLPRWFEAAEGEQTMAPWQHDFMSIVLGQLAENDVPGARKLFLWTVRFGLGRFLAEGEGYCRANAPGYWLEVRDKASKAAATTWAQLQRLNWPQQGSCAGAAWIDGHVACTDCYTSIAAAALATMVNLGVEAAQEPYDYVRKQTVNRTANYAVAPGFAIVPRRLTGQ